MSERIEETGERPADTASPGRRQFLTSLSIGLGALGAAIAAIPTLGFIVAPIFKRQLKTWRNVGSVDQFAIGTTTSVHFRNAGALPWDGVSAHTAAWLRRDAADEFVAFSVDCTHLGCPVRWEPGANLFMCPCHGGVYYNDGAVAGGPPPRPLPRYPVRVRNGHVEIETEPIPIG
jgi:menaquinol-cytochrome c reductase iron-sulfur subunit